MLAIDLPGLGASERRDDLLTPPAMGRFLLDVVDSFDRFAESCRYVRSYPAELPVLAGKLGTITSPVQILTWARDHPADRPG